MAAALRFSYSHSQTVPPVEHPAGPVGPSSVPARLGARGAAQRPGTRVLSAASPRSALRRCPLAQPWPQPAGTQSGAPPGDRVGPRRHRWPPSAASAPGPGAGPAPSAPRPSPAPHGRPSESPAAVPAPAEVGVTVPPLPDALRPQAGGGRGRLSRAPRPGEATHSRPPLPWLRFHGQRGGRVTAAVQREPRAPPPRRAGGGSGTDPAAPERPARPSSRQRESP